MAAKIYDPLPLRSVQPTLSFVPYSRIYSIACVGGRGVEVEVAIGEDIASDTGRGGDRRRGDVVRSDIRDDHRHGLSKRLHRRKGNRARSRCRIVRTDNRKLLASPARIACYWREVVLGLE